MESRDSGDAKDNPLLGLEPALVLQWTLPCPYNTPDMTLYTLAIFLHSMQQKWDQWTLHGPTIHPTWPFNERYPFLNFYRLYIRFQAVITFWNTCLSLGGTKLG